MIRKVINSHDIHINGQLLRIVHQDELQGIVEGYDNVDLLLNEPRGSKYVNLIIHDSELNVEMHSGSVIDNKDMLLKVFLCSLLERGSISRAEAYHIHEGDARYTYSHEDLGHEVIHEVTEDASIHHVNGKRVAVEAVDFELSIENIAAVKEYVKAVEDFSGYKVLVHKDMHAVINEEKVIIAYPVSEVVSVLNRHFGKREIRTLNSSLIKVQGDRFRFRHFLISNSQFYIDDSDIYSKGFVIR